MKNVTKYLNVLAALFLIFDLTCCKNVGFKPSYLSDNIKESKLKDVFICEYNVDKKNLPNSLAFNYNEIWLEKKWANYLDKNKQEKFKVNDSAFQLVINFKNESFIKNVYWNQLMIKDEKGNVMGSDKDLLFINIDTLNYKPNTLKLFMVIVKEKFQPNLDTIRIGEFVLNPLCSI
jgi:hypothetical protein